MNSPIFIGGLERSGKSCMRMMLAAHQRLFFSRRTNLWTFYYNRYGNLNQADNLQLCLADLTKSKHIRGLVSDFARLKRDLEVGPVSYGRLFALVHEQHAEKLGKTRWGDQTEFIEQRADQIFYAYPDAKIIHMLRDPRDRYEALQTKSHHRRNRLGAATARWRASAELAQKNQNKYVGRYKVIRYETLVTESKMTLRETCEFLGEDFFPDMLKMQSETRFEEDSASGPLTTEYIGRYRNQLGIREVAYIQKQAGKLMSAFEYALEPIQFSWMDNLRFHLLDETVNTFNKLGWQITKT
jgi:hypothetical protein